MLVGGLLLAALAAPMVHQGCTSAELQEAGVAPAAEPPAPEELALSEAPVPQEAAAEAPEDDGGEIIPAPPAAEPPVTQEPPAAGAQEEAAQALPASLPATTRLPDDGALVIEFDDGDPALVIPRDERLTFRVKVGMGLADVGVGTVQMDCDVQSAQGGVVLLKDLKERDPKAAQGDVGHMRIQARGDYKLYSLDASIETYVYQQRWPWIVYNFEQKGSKNYKRELHLGWQEDQPHAWFRRDTDDNAPEGARVWKKPKERELPQPALDMLSAVYYARAMVRDDRIRLDFPVADKLDLWDLRLHRGKTAKLETDAGTFNAIQIVLDPRPYKDEVPDEKAQERAKKFEGLFGLQGSIELWVERETGVPLQISGDIPVGPLNLGINVLLQSYSGTPPEFRPL
jgi:hypothetical protein